MSSKNGRRVRMFVWVVAALVVVCVPSVAHAAKDGPKVYVTRSVPGRVVLEVADARVVVRKEIVAGRSTVTMTTTRDTVTLTVGGGVLSVSGTSGVASMGMPGGREYDRLLEVLGRSDAVSGARLLLARVKEGPDTFVGQSLLLTRAILETGSGSVDALDRHQRWVSDRAATRATVGPNRPRGARVIRASLDGAPQRGPGDCWEMYAEEAIKIADEFMDCTDDVQWYEAHKWAGCSLIYAMRSEGAMAWYISCNGGIPFRT